MKDTVLVDVDGTLANVEHRIHHIRQKPKNWRRFKSLAHLDEPYEDIIWLVKTMRDAGCKILIVSARSEDEREVTTQWLNETAKLKGVFERIYMRKSGDYREDSIIKRELLERIRQDGYNPFLVLDDRDRVVKMWREEGIRCLQVCEGNF